MLRTYARLLLLLLILLLVVAPVQAIAGVDLTATIVHTGNASASNVDFAVGTSDGTVTVTINNIGSVATASVTTLDVTLPASPSLIFNGAPTITGATTFSCNSASPVNHCTITDFIVPGTPVTLIFPVLAASPPAGPFQNSAVISNPDETDSGTTANDSATDPVQYNVVTPVVDLTITSMTHVGTNGSDFAAGSISGTVTAVVQNIGNFKSSGSINLTIALGGSLSFNALVSSALFSCSGASSTVVCTTSASIMQGGGDTVTFTVKAPTTPPSGAPFTNSSLISGGSDSNGANNVTADPVSFSVVNVATNTFTPTVTGTRTPTPFPTFPIPSVTVAPTLVPPTVIPTATLIPNPATSTPLPRPANAGQAVGPIPHAGVTVVVDRDGVNVRLIPAIGAAVIATVNAGFSTDILARSPDNQWVEVLIDGQLGWIGTPVLAITSGDLNSAPVADPRTIPYGGFENPRAGLTSVTSPLTGKLDNSGLRVRGGPSLAYPVLANAPRYTIFSLLGRTADNVWIQVNFEGTLGWVATEFVDLQQGLGVLAQLPIDGIVADALPISTSGADSLTETLKLMLSRVELAQPSLDSIRGTWTNIALGGRAQCGSYPARPSDFNIPNPVLAPFYATLFPLDTDFNSAMTSLRQAIDLFIDICSRPQPAEGFVGQAVVQQALDAINQTDAQFASLRQRITALLPPEGPINDNECLFTFQGRSQVVPRLQINQAQIAHLTAHDFVLGFCFDAGAGQSLKIEALKYTGNAEPRLTVSAFDNATNFIGSATISGSTTDVSIQPILITQTGRYILILADLDGAPNAKLDGQIALLLTDLTGTSGFGGASLGIDPATGNLIIKQGGAITPATPGAGVTPGLGLTPGVSTPTWTPAFGG